MNNDNFMVFVYNAIIALFAFFVAAPMLLNAISLFSHWISHLPFWIDN